MNNNLRFELNFKNIFQLSNQLEFCKLHKIYNINIPCKGLIKKELFSSTFEYIKKNYHEFNVTYHYSLYHQYSKNKVNSYKEFLDFINTCNSNKNSEILLVSGSNKKKNFDVINVLECLKNERNIEIKLGIAYNPYLNKYYNIASERNRYERKLSSGLIKSVWFQFGTDIKEIEREFNYLKNSDRTNKIIFYGSLFIPSKQFLARFNFRPWKGVYIGNKYLYSLEKFCCFTRELINFYDENNITPLLATEFSSSEKLNYIKGLLKNKSKKTYGY